MVMSAGCAGSSRRMSGCCPLSIGARWISATGTGSASMSSCPVLPAVDCVSGAALVGRPVVACCGAFSGRGRGLCRALNSRLLGRRLTCVDRRGWRRRGLAQYQGYFRRFIRKRAALYRGCGRLHPRPPALALMAQKAPGQPVQLAMPPGPALHFRPPGWAFPAGAKSAAVPPGWRQAWLARQSTARCIAAGRVLAGWQFGRIGPGFSVCCGPVGCRGRPLVDRCRRLRLACRLSRLALHGRRWRRWFAQWQWFGSRRLRPAWPFTAVSDGGGGSGERWMAGRSGARRRKGYIEFRRRFRLGRPGSGAAGGVTRGKACSLNGVSMAADRSTLRCTWSRGSGSGRSNSVRACNSAGLASGVEETSGVVGAAGGWGCRWTALVCGCKSGPNEIGASPSLSGAGSRDGSDSASRGGGGFGLRGWKGRSVSVSAAGPLSAGGGCWPLCSASRRCTRSSWR